jgi:hypothetical protein
VFHINNTDNLKSVYFAYFHAIVKYGIIFKVTHLTAKDIHLTAKTYSLYKRKLLE